MTRQSVLWWTERSLITIGVALAVYCAAILVEARFHQTAPLPPTLTVTQTVLPGDPGDLKAPAPAPTAVQPAAGPTTAPPQPRPPDGPRLRPLARRRGNTPRPKRLGSTAHAYGPPPPKHSRRRRS